MTFIRRASVALIVVLLALVPLGLAVGKAEAAPKAAVGGGTSLVFGGKYLCTMTAVGRDSGGRLVGLTAAHCAKGGSYNVSLRHKRSAGVVGRVSLINRAGDFAVVTLDTNRVRPVRSVGQARITGVGRFPAFGTNVCKLGATTGFSCGPVLADERVKALSYVCAAPGDSGAPVLHGSRVVGMLTGGRYVGGVLIECPMAGFPIHSPMVATKLTDILRALNSYGRVGAGFRVI